MTTSPPASTLYSYSTVGASSTDGLVLILDAPGHQDEETGLCIVKNMVNGNFSLESSASTLLNR